MKSLEEQIADDIQAFKDFLDEAPTIRCGENGCDSCNLAFHRSCDPVLPAPALQMPASAMPTDSFILDDEWEADTIPDIVAPRGPDMYIDLGGEG